MNVRGLTSEKSSAQIGAAHTAEQSCWIAGGDDKARIYRIQSMLVGFAENRGPNLSCFGGHDLNRAYGFGVRHVPEGRYVIPEITVGQLMRLRMPQLLDYPQRHREILKRVQTLWRHQLEWLSGGERALISTVAAMDRHCKVLLLEEWLEGVDVVSRELLLDFATVCHTNNVVVVATGAICPSGWRWLQQQIEEP